MREHTKYSIVIPVFNSSKLIGELVDRCVRTMASLDEKFELILVDDCSDDESWVTMKELKQKHKELTLIKLSKNFGQFAATFCGVEHAKGDIIITIDDDLQYPPEEILNLIDYFKNNEQLLVYGVPKKKKYTALTKLYAWIMQLFVYLTVFRLYMPRGYYYTSFRIFNKGTLWSDDLKGKSKHFDIFALWHLAPKYIGFTYVNYKPRKRGKSGQTFRKKSNDAILNAMCTFRSPLQLMYTFSVVIVFLVVLLSVLSFCSVNVLEKISLNIAVILILIFIAAMFFSLFVIGVFLGRIFALKRGHRDYYIIEHIK